MILSTSWRAGRRNQLGLTPDEAVNTLLFTARDVGPPGPDATFGSGLLDVAAAVREARAEIAFREAQATPPPATGPAAEPRAPTILAPTPSPTAKPARETRRRPRERRTSALAGAPDEPSPSPFPYTDVVAGSGMLIVAIAAGRQLRKRA